MLQVQYSAATKRGPGPIPLDLVDGDISRRPVPWSEASSNSISGAFSPARSHAELRLGDRYVTGIRGPQSMSEQAHVPIQCRARSATTARPAQARRGPRDLQGFSSSGSI
nr:hypothetical protein CFP56_70412 [Quercus suber]